MKNKVNWDVELASYKASGVTMHELCEEKGYSVSALKNHLYKKPKDPDAIMPVVPVTSFVEVKPAVAPTLTIQFGGAQIIVDTSTNVDLLKKVMKVMNDD